ncbi:MAG: NosD domain-containing protein [Acidobacteriota bacterium]
MTRLVPSSLKNLCKPVLGGLCLGLVLWAAPAWASNGRIPIDAPGTVISAPGSYYLVADLDAGGTGGDAIDVEASHVTIDLNGHTITADSGADGVSTALASGPVENVRITGGRINGGLRGTYLTGVTACRVDHVTFTGQAYYPIGVIAPTGATAMAQIDHNIILASGANSGISGSGIQGGLMTDNVVKGTARAIFLNNCYEIQIARNNCSQNTSNGIALVNCDHCTLRGNTCEGNGANAIVLNGCHDVMVRDNLCSQNTSSTGADGIALYSSNDNTVDWNLADGNSTYGLQIDSNSSGNRYSFNVALNNGSGGYSIAANNTDAGHNH